MIDGAETMGTSMTMKLFHMRVLMAAVLTVGTMLGGCTAPKETPSSSLDMSEYRKMLERQKKEQEALDNNETKTPEMTPEEHERAGDAEGQRRNYPLAGLHYTKALTSDPARNSVRLKLGQLMLQQGMFDAAVTQFQDFLTREPGS